MDIFSSSPNTLNGSDFIDITNIKKFMVNFTIKKSLMVKMIFI